MTMFAFILRFSSNIQYNVWLFNHALFTAGFKMCEYHVNKVRPHIKAYQAVQF